MYLCYCFLPFSFVIFSTERGDALITGSLHVRVNRNATDRLRSYLDKSRRENKKYIETNVN